MLIVRGGAHCKVGGGGRGGHCKGKGEVFIVRWEVLIVRWEGLIPSGIY